MNPLTSPILYPALQPLLVNRLQKSINFTELVPSETTQICPQKTTANAKGENPSVVKLNDFLEIPLRQINARTQIEYVSALAFKLSQGQSFSSQGLAEQIQANLHAQTQAVTIDTPPERIWQNFIVTVVEPGWIHLRLTDTGLAEWLQWAIDFPWQIDRPDHNRPASFAGADRHSVIAFEILHAFARCNSLLHLGRESRLIQFSSAQDQSGQEIIHLSHPIPWLNGEQTFVGQHPQDWALIRQLSEAIDALAATPKTASPQADRQALKLAHRLSQAFQRFHAACRIWGMDSQNPSLTQVRLGLVWLTQRVLQILIETRLQWSATPIF